MSNGREITEENIDSMYRVLGSEFKDNQLIIASILKSVVVNYDEVIELEKVGKLFNTSDEQNKLLELGNIE